MPTRRENTSELVTLAARLIRRVRSVHPLPAGVRVLSLLDELGPLSVTRLAEADNTAQPTMSAQVAAMLERGWVVRDTDASDARRSVVRLTEAGSTALHDVRRRNGSLIDASLRDHSAAEVATAVAVLRSALTPSEGEHQA